MCLNPVKLPQPDGTIRIVPCGRCIQCVRDYQQTWVARLSEELKSWHIPDSKDFPVVFFTLTYAEENIPKNYLQVTTSGVHLTKTPLFETSPATVWNTTLKEPAKDAKERQQRLEYEFRCDLASYIDVHGDDVGDGYNIDDFSMNCEDLPSWTIPDDSIPGLPISRCLAFNSVRYSDVRSWLKCCRVIYSRKIKPVACLSDKKEFFSCNPRFISEVNGKTLPKSVITTSFKYFICSEYGPRTFRPHYHGCMFGVTESEFRAWFLPLWENRFGHVEVDSFDPNKGGMMYIAKYCSKGSFDNPLCKKDFFYPNGKEYHSKHYEGSLLRFGVDLPICDPTFRLMSHGLGIRYAFIPSVQKYWGVALNSDFVVRDVRGVCPRPSVDILRLLGLSKTLDVRYIKVSSPGFLGDPVNVFLDVRNDLGDARAAYIRKFSDSGRLIAESMVDFDLDAQYEEENNLSAKRYSRTFSTRVRDSKGRYTNQVVSKTAFSALPRYYHRWLLSPASKLYLSAHSIRVRAAMDEERAAFIRLFRTSDEKTHALRDLEFVEDLVRARSSEVLRKSAERFYSQADREDLKDVHRQ